MANRPFQVSAWGVKPQIQALRSPDVTIVVLVESVMMNVLWCCVVGGWEQVFVEIYKLPILPSQVHCPTIACRQWLPDALMLFAKAGNDVDRSRVF
jgi:hypothetical protein